MKVECLFDVNYRTACRFGLDNNGLLTCNEKEALRNKNPYVGLTVYKSNKTENILGHCNIPNEILEVVSDESWFIDGLRKGIFSEEGMKSSKTARLEFGKFNSKEVLKAAYIVQSIRFDKENDYIISLLKAKVEGKYNETLSKIVDEILKTIPKFKYKALKAYTPESFVKMQQAQIKKYKNYLEAFNRRFFNVYSRERSKMFDAATDKLTLLNIMSENQLNYLIDKANIERIKKKGSFNVNDFVLKSIIKTIEH